MPGLGEIWRGITQVGKEVTAGTVVAATRRMYVRDPRFTPAREPHPQRLSTGTRDNVRAYTQGPLMESGQLVMPMSADEILEFLLGAVQGAVTPATVVPGVFSWVFKPGTNLPDSQTWEWDDGARSWKLGGVRFNGLQITGNVAGENLVTATVFGMNEAAGALTTGGTIGDRNPLFNEGWEAKVYLDPFGGTPTAPGTTAIPNALLNWDINIGNNLERKFYADNTPNVGGIKMGAIDISGTVTWEADATQALTEYTNWTAATKRVMRLEFGGNNANANNLITGAHYRTVQIDIPLAWAGVDKGGTDRGTRVYQMPIQYVYDPGIGYGLQITCKSSRASAYAA